MGIFSFLGFERRWREPLSRPPSQRIYIVDATGLGDNRGRGGNGQSSPRDNFQMLRNLAQFAGRERIALSVFFSGRPLREAGEGADYRDVRVYYAVDARELAKKVLQLVRESVRTRDVVLITGDAELERGAIELNAACMRPATLKKAMDDRDDRGERDNERQSRGPRFRQPQQERRNDSEQKAAQPESGGRPEGTAQSAPDAASAQAASGEKEKLAPGVLDLIDPV